MNEYIFSAMLGAFGGIIRSIVGLLKAIRAKRKANLTYWLLTIIISAIMGAVAGIAFNFDAIISLVSGYAGTDAIEGLHKSFAGGKFSKKQ